MGRQVVVECGLFDGLTGAYTQSLYTCHDSAKFSTCQSTLCWVAGSHIRVGAQRNEEASVHELSRTTRTPSHLQFIEGEMNDSLPNDTHILE